MTLQRKQNFNFSFWHNYVDSYDGPHNLVTPLVQKTSLYEPGQYLWPLDVYKNTEH